VFVRHCRANLAARIRLDVARIVHVDVCLDDPAVGPAVDALRAAGFVYCALLPEFARCDGLRLQRLAPVDATTFAPPRAHPDAQQRLDSIHREYAGPRTPQ